MSTQIFKTSGMMPTVPESVALLAAQCTYACGFHPHLEFDLSADRDKSEEVNSDRQ